MSIKQISTEEANLEFLEIVEANFQKDTNLLIKCASRHRSQLACEIMAQRGDQSLANVVGGFSGQRDMLGRVQSPGWMQLGYPVTRGDDEDRSYAAMKKKARKI